MKTFFLWLLLCGWLLTSCSSGNDPIADLPSPADPNQPVKPVKPDKQWKDADGNYLLPVIFHVFYENAQDPKQYVDAAHLKNILQQVNGLYNGEIRYKGGQPGVDLGVKFILAETGKDGKPLATPGVEYIKVSNVEMSCEDFMRSSSKKQYVWDPNQYINLMLYHFAPVERGIMLGVSHMPYTFALDHELEGLNVVVGKYLTNDNLNYPYCVSLNTLFVHENSDTYINSRDFSVTMAHELGHYLGLHHAFDEDEAGNQTDRCVDSDYCQDTPSYNRRAYEANLMLIFQEAQQNNQQPSVEAMLTRENCKTGEKFLSYNIMDYEFCLADRFTNDQRTRIQHVIQYSPLLPTERNSLTANKTRAVEGVMDLPIMIRE